MRLLLATLAALVLAGPAAAAAPRFALYDLQTDLAAASHDEYGDVKVATLATLKADAHGAAFVRCDSGCRFGKGWLAFAKGPELVTGDIGSARATRIAGPYWRVALALTARGRARWSALAEAAAMRRARRGLPDVLVFALDGETFAQPYADEVGGKGTLVVGGLSRTVARDVAKLLP